MACTAGLGHGRSTVCAAAARRRRTRSAPHDPRRMCALPAIARSPLARGPSAQDRGRTGAKPCAVHAPHVAAGCGGGEDDSLWVPTLTAGSGQGGQRWERGVNARARFTAGGTRRITGRAAPHGPWRHVSLRGTARQQAPVKGPSMPHEAVVSRRPASGRGACCWASHPCPIPAGAPPIPAPGRHRAAGPRAHQEVLWRSPLGLRAPRFLGRRLKHLEVLGQVLVQLQDGRDVAAAVTVVGGAPHCHQLVVEHPLGEGGMERNGSRTAAGQVRCREPAWRCQERHLELQQSRRRRHRASQQGGGCEAGPLCRAPCSRP